jgi:hypothetical protein
MKTILSIFAAASVFAAASAAQADFSADFFGQQQTYGENVDNNAAGSRTTFDPYGFFSTATD